MPINSVPEWNSTAANNTDVGGISLAENVMRPPAVNNAFRETMAQIADMFSGSVSFSAAQKGQFRANIGTDILSGVRDKLINGTPRIWQRGTGPFTTNNAYTADRWKLGLGTGASCSVSRSTLTLGASESKYAISWARSVAGSSASTLSQAIEGVETTAGQTITATFEASSTAATELRVYYVQRFGTGGSPSTAVVAAGAVSFNVTTTLTQFSSTFSIASIAGKTLGTNGDDYLQFYFERLHTATNPTATVTITGVSHVPGDATLEDNPTTPRPLGQELALCQRYYEVIEPAPTGTYNCVGVNVGGTPYGFFEYLVEKRATPTLVFPTPSATFTFAGAAGGDPGGPYSSITGYPGTRRFGFSQGMTGIGTGGEANPLRHTAGNITIDADY